MDAVAAANGVKSPAPAPAAASSSSVVVADGAPRETKAEQLIDAVLQIKRQQSHIKLTAKEVRDALLATGDKWNGVSERQVRRATEKANKQLDVAGPAPDVHTWRCSIGEWTEAELATLRGLAFDGARTQKAVIDAKPGAPLDAIFTFAAHWTARRLCKVRRACGRRSARGSRLCC